MTKQEIRKLLQRMPDELYERVQKLSKDSGVSVNAIVNKACEQYLASGDLPAFERRLSQLEKDVTELKEERKKKKP